MRLPPHSHRQARAFLYGGLGAAVLLLVADALLAPTGVLATALLVLLVLAAIAAFVGFGWLVAHPVRRRA